MFWMNKAWHSTLHADEIKKVHISGVTTHVKAQMLQTHIMTPSLIYKVSFFLRKISVCQN